MAWIDSIDENTLRVQEAIIDQCFIARYGCTQELQALKLELAFA
ncbi:hypothetical protein [Thalassolituus maritimus]|nr:hypothetical protein [Thalassolituus maritimus]